MKAETCGHAAKRGSDADCIHYAKLILNAMFHPGCWKEGLVYNESRPHLFMSISGQSCDCNRVPTLTTFYATHHVIHVTN